MTHQPPFSEGPLFAVVDKKDKEALTQAILNLSRKAKYQSTTEKDDFNPLKISKSELMDVIREVERQYTRLDYLLENVIIGQEALLKFLLGGELTRAKDALYSLLLNKQDLQTLLTDELFEQWHADFKISS